MFPAFQAELSEARLLATLLCFIWMASMMAPAQNSPLELRRWSADTLARTVPDPQGPPPDSSPNSSPCVRSTVIQLKADSLRYGRSLPTVPREMVRVDNLRWEIPVGGAAAVLAQWVDLRASNRVRSEPFTTANDNASNALLGAQFGAAALTFLAGCATGHEHARRAGFATMEAGAYGALSDLALKVMFNREYPDKFRGEGRFWHGGKSFPSGHAATSWAMASALARQYEHKRWVKWAAYGAATGVTALRFTARKHFPSDLVIGGTVGYLIGRSVGAGP